MPSVWSCALHSQPAFTALKGAAQNATGRQGSDRLGQQVAQGLEMNVALAGIGQQLTKIVSHQNPFYLGMDRVDVQLFRGEAVEDECVEILGGHGGAYDLVKGRQVHR